MRGWLRVFHWKLFETIQSKVMKQPECSAHGRLYAHFSQELQILQIDLSWKYRSAQALQIRNFWEVTGRQQAGPYLSGLVCWPHYSCRHLQNCCLTNKVVVESARTLIRLRAATVKRLVKDSASGASSYFNRQARGSITCCKRLSKFPTGCFLQDLQSTCSKNQIWHEGLNKNTWSPCPQTNVFCQICPL